MASCGELAFCDEQTMSIVDDLKTSSLCQSLSQDEAARVAQIAQEKRYHKDDVIFSEDEEGVDLYVLAEGKVRIELHLGPRQTAEVKQIYTVKRGQVFGELSFLDGSPRSARAKAQTRVRLVIIDGAKLKTVLETEPPLGYKVMKNLAQILSRRLRRTNELWKKAQFEGPISEEIDYY